MPDENSEIWQLRCPDCGEYASVALAEDAEAERIATAQCPRGHRFLFQHHGQTVEMLSTFVEKG